MRQVLLILFCIVVGSKAWGTPMPKSTARHFSQLLVQDAAHKAFEDAVWETVFEPLGLGSTFFASSGKPINNIFALFLD